MTWRCLLSIVRNPSRRMPAAAVYNLHPSKPCEMRREVFVYLHLRFVEVFPSRRSTQRYYRFRWCSLEYFSPRVPVGDVFLLSATSARLTDSLSRPTCHQIAFIVRLGEDAALPIDGQDVDADAGLISSGLGGSGFSMTAAFRRNFFPSPSDRFGVSSARRLRHPSPAELGQSACGRCLASTRRRASRIMPRASSRASSMMRPSARPAASARGRAAPAV